MGCKVCSLTCTGLPAGRLTFPQEESYEKWLVRKWKIGKNIPSSVWKAIYPHVRALELVAKPFEVWVNGSQVSPEKVHKELRRVLHHSPALQSIPPETLPTGVFVREQSTFQMDLARVPLPFRAFEKHLHSHIALPEPTGQQTHDSDLFDNRDYETLDQSLRLASPVYSTNDQPIFPMASIAIPRLLTSTFHQNVVFLMSNDLAGLNAHASERIIRSLQHETSQTLFERFRSASHTIPHMQFF